LLVLHEKVGIWSFPKGGVEAGETLEQTAIREIMEETGVKKLKLLKAFPAFIRGNVVEDDLVKEINLFLFLTDEHITKPGAKISKNEWINIDDVCERLSYQEDKNFFENIKSEIKNLKT
jgi:8-oxo-dGTP pyrophosphatase MutT (NUDIX family)